MFLRHEFRRGKTIYSIALSLDDKAIMNDRGVVEIKAERRSVDNEKGETITLKVEVIPKDNMIAITHEGRVLGYIPLLKDLPQRDETKPEAIDCDAEVDAVDGDLVGDAVEKWMGIYPADPFFGCLIKAAASVCVGQLIRCYYPIRNEDPIGARLRRLGGCLRENGGPMLLRFAFRWGRCAATMGIA